MRYIYILLFFLFVGLPSQVMSQEESTASLLTGTWSFDYNASKSRMSTASIMHLDSVSPTRLARIEDSYIGRVIIFSATGNFQQTLADGHTANGTWVLSTNEENVIITDPNGNIHTQSIAFLSSTQLVLKPILDEGVIMLIPEWSFVKS